METRVTASQFQQSFGTLSDKARNGPVVITKHGRPSLVMMAAEEWERLKLAKVQGRTASLDDQTLKATQAFLKKIASAYPMREAILFGSRARNTHRPDSDVDIAIVLKGPYGDRAAAVKDMAGIAFHVMMETGVMVEALPLLPDELNHPETFSNPALIHNILREGIRL
jgi:uncharacterized protein